MPDSAPVPDRRKFQRPVDRTRTGYDPPLLARAIVDHLFYFRGRLPEQATRNDWYLALAYAVRDRLLDKWIRTARTLMQKDVRVVAYISAEFLLGPQLANNVVNLGIEQEVAEAANLLGLDFDDLVEEVRRKAAALADDAARRARLVGRPGGMPQQGGGLSTGDTGGLRADARGALDLIAARAREGDAASRPHAEEQRPAGSGETVAPGMRVLLPLGIEGVVQAVHDRMADVSVNGKRVRADLGDLKVIGRAPAPQTRVTVHVTASVSDGAATDLNVIGCTVPEAIARADKFLDQAVLAELRQVRVIHGHGTGQLRRALGEFLAAHPQVLRIVSAPPGEGGGGVTMVELKD